MVVKVALHGACAELVFLGELRECLFAVGIIFVSFGYPAEALWRESFVAFEAAVALLIALPAILFG